MLLSTLSSVCLSTFLKSEYMSQECKNTSLYILRLGLNTAPLDDDVQCTVQANLLSRRSFDDANLVERVYAWSECEKTETDGLTRSGL
jgi:hypothetical protein